VATFNPHKESVTTGSMDKQRLTIYLSGPISHCNEKQRSEWRKTVKTALRKKGHACIDPADHMVDWNPYKEIIDIDKSDILIANLWRESIGTVLGIVQARRMGKPVILIDPNYIDSAVLREIVGEDRVVHSLDGAINKLESEAISLFGQRILVQKKRGSSEPLSEPKLQRSLNRVCSEAGVNDAIFAVLVTKRALAAVRHEAESASITTDKIKQAVFDQLEQLSSGTDKLYAEDFKQSARRLKQTWERQQTAKDEKRVLDELALREKDWELKLQECKRERDSLKFRLEGALADQKSTQTQHTTMATKKPTSLKEVARLSRDAYHGSLVILDEAVMSASDCPYSDFDKVAIALGNLADYVKQKQAVQGKETSGARAPGLREWLRQANCPFEYAAHESETTSNNRECRQERTFTYEGTKFVMLKHLKIGGSSPNQGCRIHFELLGPDHENKILIGHIGRHLKTVGGA
jgi:transcriptional regulator NrdR family protein